MEADSFAKYHWSGHTRSDVFADSALLIILDIISSYIHATQRRSISRNLKMSSSTEESLPKLSDTPEKLDGSNPSPEKIQIVEFDGPDDPFDPKNFSTSKKWFILLVVTHGAIVVTCTSSLYVFITRLGVC